MNLEDLGGSAAKLLVCLAFNAEYIGMAGLSRKHYYRALKELECSGFVQVERKPPRPPNITLTSQVNGVIERRRSEMTDRLIDEDTKVSSDHYSDLSLSINSPNSDARASVLDEPDRFFPGFEPISGNIFDLSTVVKKTTATVDKFTTVVKKTTVDSSENDYSSEKDHSNSGQKDYSSQNDYSEKDASVNITTVDNYDLLAEADEMPVDMSEGVRQGSSFQRRKQRQIDVLQDAYREIFPFANPIPRNTVGVWLGKVGNKGAVVYEQFIKARENGAKNPSKYLTTMLSNYVAEMEVQSAPPRYPAKSNPVDDFAPYDGALVEETPEESAERRARAERLKYLFEPK